MNDHEDRPGGDPLGPLLKRVFGHDTFRPFQVVEQFPVMERRLFEELLGGLARGGMVKIDDDQFEKDGRTIRFRRAYLTGTGRRRDAAIEASIPVAPLSVRKRKRGKRRS